MNISICLWPYGEVKEESTAQMPAVAVEDVLETGESDEQKNRKPERTTHTMSA